LRKPRQISRPVPFDHFGLLAPLYERFIRPPQMENLLRAADLSHDDRLLDVGGGTGRVSQLLAPAVHEIWLADVSVGMLEEAKAKRVGLIPCVCRAEALPFPCDAFTKVIAVDSFHHFRTYQAAASELLRVAAPGGRIVVEEPDIRRLGVKLVALGETLALMRSRFHRPDGIVRLFRSVSCDVAVSVIEEGHTFWVVVDKL